MKQKMVARESIKNKKGYIYVILIYSLLTLFMTWPLMLNLTSHLAGETADNLEFIWDFWWVKKALLMQNTSIFYTDYMFHPIGVNLGLQDLSFFNSLSAVPLQALFNMAVAYNVLTLLSFVMGAFGAYLLAKHLTKNTCASFIAGIVFSFCPYHFAHTIAGHLSLLSIQWMPFFVLYLLRTFEEKTKKNAILAATFLILAALCSWYFLLYFIFFTFLFLIYNLVYRRKEVLSKDFIKCFTLFVLVASLVIFIFAYPGIKEALTEKSFWNDINPETYSADLFNFFLPSALHPLFMSSVVKFTGNNGVFHTPIIEGLVSIGFLVLMLSLYSLFKIKLKKTGFWIISALFFGIMALGPKLYILGKPYLTNVYLPYYWLVQKIPILKIATVPGRFSIMVMLSLSVLVGYASARILDSFNKKKLIASLISLIIIFEFLIMPFPIAYKEVPEFYKIISKDTDDYGLIEVPVIMERKYVYYQTIHNKKLVDGSLSRLPFSSHAFIDNNPFIRLLANPYNVEDVGVEIPINLLKENKIKYVIINKKVEDFTCEEFYYFIKTIKTRDYSFCEHIDNSYYNACMALSKDDLSFCGFSLNNPVYQRYLCYQIYYTSKSKNKEDICNKLFGDEIGKKICMDVFKDEPIEKACENKIDYMLNKNLGLPVYEDGDIKVYEIY